MIKLSSIFLFSVMMTTAVMGGGDVKYTIDLGHMNKGQTIIAPKNITGLQLKQAIEKNFNLPIDKQKIVFKGQEIPDDAINLYEMARGEKFSVLRKRSLTDEPITISFLGSHKDDSVPQSIVGDLELQLPHDATVKDLHTQLEARPELEGYHFALAVNNIIFTKNDTLLVDYRNQRFQILIFQPQT